MIAPVDDEVASVTVAVEKASELMVFQERDPQQGRGERSGRDPPALCGAVRAPPALTFV